MLPGLEDPRDRTECSGLRLLASLRSLGILGFLARWDFGVLRFWFGVLGRCWLLIFFAIDG